MALPATDTFTNATGSDQALTTYSANWSLSVGNFIVTHVDDVCRCNATTDSLAYWNADSFGNDQYAQAAVVFDGGAFSGVAVRTTSNNGYGFFADASTYYLFRIDSGSFVELASGSAASFVDGDILRLEVTGQNPCALVMKRNGAQVGSTYNDSNANRKLSGAAGVAGYGTNTSATSYIDSWEGGNLGGSSSPARLGGKHLFALMGA